MTPNTNDNPTNLPMEVQFEKVKLYTYVDTLTKEQLVNFSKDLINLHLNSEHVYRQLIKSKCKEEFNVSGILNNLG